MTWAIISIFFFVGLAGLVAYEVRKRDAARQKFRALPLSTVAALPAYAQARIRVRVVSCEFPVDTPITERVCCAYRTCVWIPSTDGPSSYVVQQYEEASFRAADDTGELLVHLRDPWALDDSLKEYREIKDKRERDLVAQHAQTWLGKASVKLSEGVVLVGMTIEIAGELHRSGQDLTVTASLISAA